METAQQVNEDIQSLPRIADVIEDLGYEVGQTEEVVAVKVPVADAEPFTAVVTLDEDRNKLVIVALENPCCASPQERIPETPSQTRKRPVRIGLLSWPPRLKAPPQLRLPDLPVHEIVSLACRSLLVVQTLPRARTWRQSPHLFNPGD